MLDRRRVLLGVLAAPFIVRTPGLLMPVRAAGYRATDLDRMMAVIAAYRIINASALAILQAEINASPGVRSAWAIEAERVMRLTARPPTAALTHA